MTWAIPLVLAIMINAVAWWLTPRPRPDFGHDVEPTPAHRRNMVVARVGFGGRRDVSVA